jgi:surface protein
MSKAGKKNGVVLQGLCSTTSGVNRDLVHFYSGIERDYITYRIKTDQVTGGITTCKCKVSNSTGTVYWGDGSFDAYTSSLDITHDYGVAGTYEIYLYTDGFKYLDVGNSDRPKYLAIRDLRKQEFTGYSEYSTMNNIVVEANAGAPIAANVTRPGRAFVNCDSIVTINASQWTFPDPSPIIYFADNMFQGSDSFNDSGVSGWPINLFRNINNMFDGCTSFDVDLSNWATRIDHGAGARSLSGLFKNCTAFTNGGVGGVGAGLDSWQIDTVTSVSSMFAGSCGFNDRLDTWNTSLISNMSSMFNGNSAFTNAGQSGVLLGIDAWDTSAVEDMGFMFSNYRAGSGFYVGSWVTSNVTDMERMFGSTTYYFSNWGTWNNGSIDNWNVSNVTTMAQMFNDVSAFNQPLNNWRPSSCTNFTQMFAGAYNTDMTFDQNIGAWTFLSTSKSTGTNSSVTTNALVDTAANFLTDQVESGDKVENITDGTIANVTAVTATQLTLDTDIFPSSAGDSYRVFTGVNMQLMFGRFAGSGENSFNNGGSNSITNWSVQNVGDMSSMFKGCTSFDQPLGWTTSALRIASGLFSKAEAFNQNIGSWDMGKVTTTESMFSGATVFNNGSSNTIANWDLSKVTTAEDMFRGASSFNQDIPNWDLSSCTNMAEMFRNATAFNGNVSNWQTDSMENASFMFSSTSFDQDISNWSIASLTNAGGFISFGTPFSTANYDLLLDSVTGWPSQSTIQQGASLNTMPQYTSGGNAEAGKNYLTGTKGWTIVDGGPI